MVDLEQDNKKYVLNIKILDEEMTLFFSAPEEIGNPIFAK